MIKSFDSIRELVLEAKKLGIERHNCPGHLIHGTTTRQQSKP